MSTSSCSTHTGSSGSSAGTPGSSTPGHRLGRLRQARRGLAQLFQVEARGNYERGRGVTRLVQADRLDARTLPSRPRVATHRRRVERLLGGDAEEEVLTPPTGTDLVGGKIPSEGGEDRDTPPRGEHFAGDHA